MGGTGGARVQQLYEPPDIMTPPFIVIVSPKVLLVAMTCISHETI